MKESHWTLYTIYYIGILIVGVVALRAINDLEIIPESKSNIDDMLDVWFFSLATALPTILLNTERRTLTVLIRIKRYFLILFFIVVIWFGYFYHERVLIEIQQLYYGGLNIEFPYMVLFAIFVTFLEEYQIVKRISRTLYFSIFFIVFSLLLYVSHYLSKGDIFSTIKNQEKNILYPLKRSVQFFYLQQIQERVFYGSDAYNLHVEKLLKFIDFDNLDNQLAKDLNLQDLKIPTSFFDKILKERTLEKSKEIITYLKEKNSNLENVYLSEKTFQSKEFASKRYELTKWLLKEKFPMKMATVRELFKDSEQVESLMDSGFNFAKVEELKKRIDFIVNKDDSLFEDLYEKDLVLAQLNMGDINGVLYFFIDKELELTYLIK